MEKLIELLNKYCDEEEIKYKRYFLPNHIQWEGCDNSECSDLLIVSKKFGFIKWLVYNHRIDYDKAKQGRCIPIACNEVGLFANYGDYETTLMLLTIQDYPIDFLCSILKEGEKKESEGKLVKGGYASFNEYGELMEEDTLQELKDLGKI